MRAEIARQMELGHCSLDSVAQSLRMPPRSLQRRLRAEGLSLRELVDDWRRARALALVTNSRLPLSATVLRTPSLTSRATPSAIAASDCDPALRACDRSQARVRASARGEGSWRSSPPRSVVSSRATRVALSDCASHSAARRPGSTLLSRSANVAGFRKCVSKKRPTLRAARAWLRGSKAVCGIGRPRGGAKQRLDGKPVREAADHAGFCHRPDQPQRGGGTGKVRRQEDRRHQPEHGRGHAARAHQRGRRRRILVEVAVGHRSRSRSRGRPQQEALDRGGGPIGMGEDEEMAAIDQFEPGVGQPAGQNPAVDHRHDRVVGAHHDQRRDTELGEPKPAGPADPGQQLVKIAARRTRTHGGGVLDQPAAVGPRLAPINAGPTFIMLSGSRSAAASPSSPVPADCRGP